MTASTAAVGPAALPARSVLADLIPATMARTVALVLTGTLLVAAASQVKLGLGFTPVPINGATFAVMVVGASLGMGRGAAAFALYLAAGIVGMPFFTDGASGWTYATGATGGYLLGYLVAGVLLGALAERGTDRRVLTAVPAMLLATAVIYTLGGLWLAVVLDVPVFGWESSAWTLGVRPFLAGDAFKLVLAGLVLPTAWRLVGDRRRQDLDSRAA